MNALATAAIVVGSILTYAWVTGFVWRRYASSRHEWVQRIHDSRPAHDRRKIEHCLDCQTVWTPLTVIGTVLWPLTLIGFLPVWTFIFFIHLGNVAATPKRTRAELEARIAELEAANGIGDA